MITGCEEERGRAFTEKLLKTYKVFILTDTGILYCIQSIKTQKASLMIDFCILSPAPDPRFNVLNAPYVQQGIISIVKFTKASSHGLISISHSNSIFMLCEAIPLASF